MPTLRSCSGLMGQTNPFEEDRFNDSHYLMIE